MIQLMGVSKQYRKNRAVENLSFEIKQGEIFGLIGANGAGKSTTISMIATLLKPDQGDILYRGVSVVKKPVVMRKELGYVPQDIGLYPFLTGYDNLCFFGKAYRIPQGILEKRIEEVSSILGFTKELLKIPVQNYSGGMKRRLNIGVALLHNPSIVIMDEPTVGIDLIARNQILEGVLALKNQGITVIYSSHYMEEVERICDSICVLNQGNQIICGEKDHLLSYGNEKISLEQLYLDVLR